MTAGRRTRGMCSRVFVSQERAMVAEPTYLAPGVVLQDRYEIADEIGRGGFSIVYRARDRRVGADVAIKLLVPPPAAARLARERLRREVQVVRQLSHPNIVAVYDVVDDGPWSFVVMEYVPGPDLAVRVRQRGPLDPDAVARLGREITAALAAAHRHGILHRDVKPQNILLAPDGRARLTDFGSARLSGQETVTQTGGLVGTADYAAPEQLGGGRGDARADEDALGGTPAGTTCSYSSSGPRRDRRGARCEKRWRSGSGPECRRPPATRPPAGNARCSASLPRRAPAWSSCSRRRACRPGRSLAPARGGPRCRRRSWCSPASSRRSAPPPGSPPPLPFSWSRVLRLP